jgi:hypothetical protein
MATTRHLQSSTVSFHGKSGARYRFQAWPLDAKFKARGGIYIVTKRECLDRTFPSMGTHRCLAIGQTADFAASVLTQSELSKLTKQGANCICVYAIADEARRLAVEQDLIDGNEQWGGHLHYLFRPDVPGRAPGIPDDPRPAGIA